MTKLRINESLRPSLLATLAAVALGAAGATTAFAQNYPVTPQQRAVAQQTSQAGIPISELAPNAPDEYTVKPGDTLWAISRLFLRSPWRWPELWGMNIKEISNPHRIYPGQVLFLDKSGGRARLSTRRGGASDGTIKLSPRARYESLSGMALPTLNPSLIEPFLSEPIIVDEDTLKAAPHIVAGNDSRVLLARGDRAYALGQADEQLIETAGPIKTYRIFRNATPLKDPATGELLGYEAAYLGKAQLKRSQTVATQLVEGKDVVNVVPATIDIVAAREEMRAGDRLLPEPTRQLLSYAPRAPEQIIDGRIVSVYGNAVQFAAQNQVVVINKGTRDGIESGHVLAILKNGDTIVDRAGAPNDTGKEVLKLPNERIGLLMVFRPFEKASYALVLEINDTPRVGDLLVNP
ncbi:LysM peptidoglycan-binding domain-containing protein [Variovorax ginsengisoli]|uniref:LysM peptidoglycan-binding domain-containing protein n=1 Tax=Variovorax ginsengisoli TaxID=363844 RepID=A0ABT8RX24_9BURK|nr:LysM peptidoglycan-binding domain-containing protein [Variovorax ginsengisoli]MDN8612020.1 LysM peptidoglycan-binding domain-containing protein [Variovorax ginsengisoli]MDO1531190.1 LysM peptidoglycan-binding domain-containing protein [Variovorax ginsengisoli]